VTAVEHFTAVHPGGRNPELPLCGQRSSAALQVGDQTFAGFDQFVGLDAEDVVPRAGGGPHLVVLQQVGVDEDAQVGLVTEGRHTFIGLGNPFTLEAIQRQTRGLCKTEDMNAMGYVGAIISIIAGCLGLIWPKQVSRTIGLQIPGRLGQSEVRATYGGLFIGAGLAVTLIASSDAALVLGAAWAGAFIARAISFVIDKSRTKENVAGLVIEGVMAALLILA